MCLEKTASENSELPENQVISQDPVGSTQVAAGAPVDLVVSLGPAPVIVPNVVEV
jgi:beta-lactam-binding protein with PASTA domain